MGQWSERLKRYKSMSSVIESRGIVSVKQLSELFRISIATVRRDLLFLEKEGGILRTRGGATSVNISHSNLIQYEMNALHMNEQRIALEAASRIQDGDTVLLDDSAKALQVALLLPNMAITIVTNSLKIACQLANRSQIEVIIIGGSLQRSSLSNVGLLTEHTLKQFYVSKAFLSCDGLHVVHGLSETDLFQAQVKRQMIEAADIVHVLADHSRIGLLSSFNVSALDQIDVVITDDVSILETVKHLDVVVA